MNEGSNLNEVNQEQQGTLTWNIVLAWLNNQGFAPTPPLDIENGRTVVRSTDDICDDLADIADLDPNDVAAIMLGCGYKLLFPKTGKHGWLLYQHL